MGAMLQFWYYDFGLRIFSVRIIEIVLYNQRIWWVLLLKRKDEEEAHSVQKSMPRFYSGAVNKII